MQAADQQHREAATQPRRADIQGLRAIAVLAVILFHAGLPLPGGFVGVDIFFVISGFVITAMLLREFRATGRIRLVRFYVRRFKRLSPALALVVVVTMLLAAALLSPLGTQQDVAKTGIGALLLAANLVIAMLTGDYFGLAAETNALLHTWSLAVEEQFYLVFPAVLTLAWFLRRKGATWAPVAAVALLGVASIGVLAAGVSGASLGSATWLLGFYSPLTRAWEFAAGSLLALVAHKIPRIFGSLAVAALGVALLAASLVFINTDSTFPGPITLLPVLGSMCLLLSGLGNHAITRFLSSKPMVVIGDLSYSLYLWHWPLIVLASVTWPNQPLAAPLAAGVSVVPAVLSYRFVEQPIRTMSTPSLPRLLRLVAAVTSLPLVASFGLWQLADRGFGIPRVQAFQNAVFDEPERGCKATVALNAERAISCLAVEGEGRPIYVLGDSHAGHFSDGLVLAGEQLGRPVVVNFTNSCPFLDVFLDTSKPLAGDLACRAYSEKSLEFLDTATQGTVFIGNIDTYWSNRSSAGLEWGDLSDEPDCKLEVFGSALRATVTRLERAGHDVVIAQTIPRFTGSDAWRTEGCTVSDLNRSACTHEMSLANVEERQGAVHGVIASVGVDAGAGVFDSWPLLCPGGVCSTQGESFPRYYRDGIHLSVLESEALARHFVQLLGESGR